MHPLVTRPRNNLRRASRGFTLIELITVMVIAAIVVSVGVPMLTEFVADQRVRTTTSDLMSEIAFARVKAVEQSRRVFFERTGTDWRDGWRIYADLNNNGSFDAGEELKVFNGFPAGNMYICSTVGEFADNMVFRPDGRVVRTSAQGANDGIYVVDLLGDTVLANNKIRGVLFGVSGRPTVVRMNGAAAPC